MNPLVHEFLSSNGTDSENENLTSEDIEMLAVHHPTCYTSLRDIISTTSAAGVATPPMPGSPSSWDDIPIRNSLVKHAALAYLQPMSTPPEIDDRSWVERMKESLCRCCLTGDREEGDMEVAQVGCLGLLDGVVWLPIMEALGRILRKRVHQD